MNIDLLLKNYFEGNTSLKEEGRIRSWYRRTPLEKMTPQQREYAPLFGFFEEEKKKSETQLRSAAVRKIHLRILYIAGSVAVAASIAVGLILYLDKPVVAVHEESAYSFNIGGVEVEDDEAAKEFANEQMKKLSRIMNPKGADQKLGIFKKMMLRADNIMDFNEIYEDENNE